tara:strand:+ start:2872 stop:3330 length:459 start_codon:yes stop_codon:yes gene_type:complete
MAIPEKYYNYLACIGLGLVLFFILDKILAVDHSTVREPFKDSAKNLKEDSSSKEAALSKLVDISKKLTKKLEMDVYGKKAPNTDQPPGGIYQQILEEVEDALELGQLASILSFADGEMKSADAIKLGDRIEKFRTIREACKESVEFIQSDRH